MWLGLPLIAILILGFSHRDPSSALGLPLIQISHDDAGEDYPEMQEEVHLEDFFWTGSGDGPPEYLKKVHTGISKGKEVIVKTETVVATVYVDGNNEIDIPICLDCFPNDGSGANWGLGGGSGGPLPFNYSATDRRYWLLTVMSGFYSQKDNPMLEEKLARLYRLAFTRQQSRHLGINGAQQISGIAVENTKDRRDQDALEPPTTTETDPGSEVEILNMATDIVNHPKLAPDSPPANVNSELISSEETDATTSTETPQGSTEASTPTDSGAVVTLFPWEFIQQGGASEKQKQAMAAIFQPQQHLASYPRDRVRVVIHNITQITEDEVQNGVPSAVYDEDVNDKIDDRPVANQTELIYSVFVNGRPVLASTAANDMKLVSEHEVSEVIGKEIFMKAEPYLREPQATPLAPATRSGSIGFIDSIQNNPALVIVTSIAILLLLLLLLALLLMGRSKHRDKMTEVKRVSSRNELLSESQSTRPVSSGTLLDTGRSTVQSRDVGIQNFSFEHEGGSRVAHIDFPGPPHTAGSRRGSISSSDNTSDSSVYCPINPPTADVQRILDEKAATLFEKHHRRHRTEQRQYDRAEGREEAVYTSVMADKNGREKGGRHKAKRRYLSENRVGSLETSPTQHSRPGQHSSGEEAATDSHDSDALRPSYENFEHPEAFNPHNNYHRNKLLHQKNVFRDKEYAGRGGHEEQMHATEAINREIIRALQPSEKSSDTGSIGSFLSMASVKAFPKSALPEPLNRVLDPVFVTYYDNVDESLPTAVQPMPVKPGKSSRKAADPLDATIDRFPTPKAPPKSARTASQSDNPDPGVVGPIVWERHKKGLSEDLDNGNDDDVTMGSFSSNFSPVRDPAALRNHYEGLLEGAMQMYSSQDDLPMPLPTRDFTNNRKPTKRENRGSSAGQHSYSAKPSRSDARPATAQPDKTPKSNQSTQPPSPTLGAWGGSVHGSHSPLVRPMSAGPFHRPEPLQPHLGGMGRPAKSKGELSAAPLIEAIQQELRKFKQEDT